MIMICFDGLGLVGQRAPCVFLECFIFWPLGGCLSVFNLFLFCFDLQILRLGPLRTLYSSHLCMYWDRFAPDTAGGAWNTQALRCQWD